jgi:hypothetical protein
VNVVKKAFAADDDLIKTANAFIHYLLKTYLHFSIYHRTDQDFGNLSYKNKNLRNM